MPPRLMPASRGTDAHTEALRRLVSRGSLVDRFNHTHPQICRIWLGHGAFQKPNRPPRLGLSEPLGNPDSIPTETALSNPDHSVEHNSMGFAASLRSQHQTRLALSITFTVMAGLVPAIGRGTLPLRMAGTSPAMTVRAGFIQLSRAACAMTSIASGCRERTVRLVAPESSHARNRCLIRSG